MARRLRLDALLVERGLAPDLERARALCMAGLVVVGEGRVDKPGTSVAPDAAVRVRGRGHAYVSRGALKLLAALERSGVEPAGRVALDLGASTGGFTQVLLERGAARIYAVDVGRDQLAWSLRQEPRVVSLEQTHARDLDAARVPEPISLLVADVSFISLRQVLPPVFPLLAPGADLLLLVKPQFEARASEVPAGGVVTDPAVRARAGAEIADFLNAAGFSTWPLGDCPVPGATGNVELLLHARAAGGGDPVGAPSRPLEQRR